MTKYAQDDYDIDRYNRLNAIVVHTLSEHFDLDPITVQTMMAQSIGTTTPKCGADAAVFHQKQLLVLQRSAHGTWCLPCGWVNIGEDYLEAAVRETREETGLSVIPDRLLTIQKKGPANGSAIVHQLNALVLMHALPTAQVKLSHEHVSYAWITQVSDIDNWHIGHKQQAILALQQQPTLA